MDQLRHFGFLVKDVSRLWTRHFEQRAAQFGVSLTQCKVLVYISRNEGATQARIAELSDTDPMTLVRTLDRMERDGWIERRPDPTDRRAYRLYRKPASNPILEEITRIAEKARGEALAGLSAEQREQMVELLDHVRRNLVALLPASSASPAPEDCVTEPRAPRRGAKAKAPAAAPKLPLPARPAVKSRSKTPAPLSANPSDLVRRVPPRPQRTRRGKASSQ